MTKWAVREATVEDIQAIQIVRHAVRENRLSDPGRVTDKDVGEYIHERGKGWVCEHDGHIVGFAIGDLQDANIWALFIRPEMEGRGIGKILHDIMIAWMFDQGMSCIWLSTDPGTRAERFYRKAGWTETGITPSGEIRFELSRPFI